MTEEMKKPRFMTMKQRKEQGIELPFRGWIVGEPGSGKSSSAAHLANNLPEHGKVIFFDSNAESLGGVEMFLTDYGSERFIHVPIYSENLDTKGAKAVEGSVTDQIEQGLIELDKEGLLDSKDTHVFIDGITDICNDLMRINHKTSAKTGGEDMMQTYLQSQNQYVSFMGKLMKATRKCSLWIIGHLVEVQFEGSKPQWGLDAITKSFSTKVLNGAGIPNLFVYQRVVDKDGKQNFNVYVKPSVKYKFIKNVCATYEGFPAETDQKDFLPTFINAFRNKKWDKTKIKIE